MKMRMIKGYMVLTLAAFLPACDLYEEGHLSENRVQVVEERYAEQLPLEALTESSIAALGKHYTRYGDGPVDLTLVYDPKSRTNTAMHASNEAARLTRLFRQSGIRDIRTNITPVPDFGDNPEAIISFVSYSAQAPKDCSIIAGIDNRKIDVDPEYKFGCSVETVFSKQIARPKDLAGRARMDEDTDGRRAGNIVEGYRTGQPNEPLGGESASDN